MSRGTVTGDEAKGQAGTGPGPTCWGEPAFISTSPGTGHSPVLGTETAVCLLSSRGQSHSDEKVRPGLSPAAQGVTAAVRMLMPEPARKDSDSAGQGCSLEVRMLSPDSRVQPRLRTCVSSLRGGERSGEI